MTPPSSIGHFRIVSKLGEGGMGAVYRAFDTKLNREVAIKVLPDSVVADPDRMARFQREAQVLAALNHPNIATIYGVEEGAIVMELVEGADLSGPLPLEAALDYAGQIAEGLEAAHEKGIVHRDLKPANIKVTPDGKVKLLDFGLAKAADGAPAVNATQSPTLSMNMTQAGMILGTAAYMAPEQARGKPVDKRADIWAFGAILFEMLSGTQPFPAGETVTDIIAAVVTREPEWALLPPETPPQIRRLLERCLRKDPKMRLRDIGEARIALQEPAIPASVPEPAARSRMPWIIAGAATAIAILALGFLWMSSHSAEQRLMRMTVDLGPDAITGIRLTAAISPDGTRIVFVGRSADGKEELQTRLFDQPAAVTITGTDGASDPFFSPDGKWIGYSIGNRLMKVSAQGGAVFPIYEFPDPLRGASWGEDGSIVAGSMTGGLQRVPKGGGAALQLTNTLKSGHRSHRSPQFLPGGESVLYTAQLEATELDNAEIMALDLKTGQSKLVYHGGYSARYVPSGHLVFVRQGALFAVRFRLRDLQASGEPVRLADDVHANISFGGAEFAVSRSGILAYRPGKSIGGGFPIVWMDPAGKTTPLIARPDVYITPRLSPDGRMLAVAIAAGSGADLHIWDIQRQTLTQLTFNQRNKLHPVWMPDGRHLVFASRFNTATTLWWARADGGSEPRKLLESDQSLLPHSVSPDGRRLAYHQGTPDVGSDIWTLPLDLTDPENPKAGTPELFLRTPMNEGAAEFSPDGHWIAYHSDESHRSQVYVRPFPAGPGKWLISRDGGAWPRFSGDGRHLFYEGPNGRLMIVDYQVQSGSFIAGAPRPWCERVVISSFGAFGRYDVASDGLRVLALANAEGETQGPVHVTLLLNLFDELRRLLP